MTAGMAGLLRLAICPVRRFAQHLQLTMRTLCMQSCILGPIFDLGEVLTCADLSWINLSESTASQIDFKTQRLITVNAGVVLSL